MSQVEATFQGVFSTSTQTCLPVSETSEFAFDRILWLRLALLHCTPPACCLELPQVLQKTLSSSLASSFGGEIRFSNLFPFNVIDCFFVSNCSCGICIWDKFARIHQSHNFLFVSSRMSKTPASTIPKFTIFSHRKSTNRKSSTLGSVTKKHL